ncbi:putative Heat shock 70 kDa protein 14 [Cocos nucifera]|uniref:Putative Heat shock 70 kDa protein 14 n=1 Tax=Cocos nucifera TaxID=13894 RepID=A0A8K0I4B2_COCNU|nr:putative Heat shock 70 kDa protein 14 [Cocos nucifera]
MSHPTSTKMVVNECAEAETWLGEKKQQQDALPKHAVPVLLCADVRRKAETLDRFCRPIMTKPRPPPAKPQTPPPAETAAPSQANEQQPQGDGASGEHMVDESGQAPPTAAEPMDTDKSGSVPDPAA